MNEYVVERELLAQNIELLKEMAHGVPIWAVVKGDGYGLGVLPLAQELAAHGIDRFCVTERREAELLRENGFADAQILMLRSVTDPEELARLLDLRVILTVGSWEAAQRIDELAQQRSEPAEVHLKIDTGMGRYGFLPEEIACLTAIYREKKHLAVKGVYTHFNCALSDKKLTRQEFAAFQAVLGQLREMGFETGTVHCCNSGAFFRHPEMYCDGVRLGSALIGRMPFSTKLRPVGYVRSEIEELRLLTAGHTTGYAALWRAKEDTRVAIVPVGWYHGLNVRAQADMSKASFCLRACLSDLKKLLRRPYTTVSINGRTCRVIGAIGMLHCAVDVTGLDCKRGDPVIVQVNPLHQKGMPVRFR